MLIWRDRSFLFHFWIVFLLGGILLGVIESFLYTDGYAYIGRYNNLRISVCFDLFSSCIFLGYVVFSYSLLWYDVQKNKKYTKILISFLIFYYFLYLYVVSYLHFYSPISYLTSYLYNGFNNGVWTQDVLSTIMQQYSIKN